MSWFEANAPEADTPAAVIAAPKGDWFQQNAPNTTGAPGGDWFATHAPPEDYLKTAAPKAMTPPPPPQPPLARIAAEPRPHMTPEGAAAQDIREAEAARTGGAGGMEQYVASHQLPEQPFGTLTEGLAQSALGAHELYQGLRPGIRAAAGLAVGIDRVPRVTGPINPEQAMSGASNIIEGAFRAASPLAAAGFAEAPLATAKALGGTIAASMAGQAGAKALGASPEAARLAGNVVALGVGGGAARYLIGSADAALEAHNTAAERMLESERSAGQRGEAMQDIFGGDEHPIVVNKQDATLKYLGSSAEKGRPAFQVVRDSDGKVLYAGDGRTVQDWLVSNRAVARPVAGGEPMPAPTPPAPEPPAIVREAPMSPQERADFIAARRHYEADKARAIASAKQPAAPAPPFTVSPEEFLGAHPPAAPETPLPEATAPPTIAEAPEPPAPTKIALGTKAATPEGLYTVVSARGNKIITNLKPADGGKSLTRIFTRDQFQALASPPSEPQAAPSSPAAEGTAEVVPPPGKEEPKSAPLVAEQGVPVGETPVSPPEKEVIPSVAATPEKPEVGQEQAAVTPGQESLPGPAPNSPSQTPLTGGAEVPSVAPVYGDPVTVAAGKHNPPGPGRFVTKLAGDAGYRVKVEGGTYDVPADAVTFAAPPPHSAPVDAAAIAALPPVKKGMVRIYRGELSSDAPRKPLPEWIRDSAKYKDSKAAEGRWATEKPEIAQWYVNDAGEHGRLTYQDVPQAVVEASRVKNDPVARRYSADPDNELFLPPTYAGQGKPIGKKPQTDKPTGGAESLADQAARLRAENAKLKGAKPGKGKSLTQAYLSEPVTYGGQQTTRGEMIADLQSKGATPGQVSAYLGGKETAEAAVTPEQESLPGPAPNSPSQTPLTGGAESATPPPQPGGAPALAEAVYQKLKAGQSLGNVTEFNKLVEEHMGASRTSGDWTPKDAFDAMEAGINKLLIERGKALLDMPYEQAMQELRGLMNRITSQGVRTEDQIKNQQFSTPPTESFTVAKVAALRPDDVMLEPSAGNGGLAVWPKALGAEVHVNEISERRQKMLEVAGFGPSTFYDGEIINSLLDPSIKPTVILMNPPFSAGTVKSNAAKNRNVYGFNHLDSALQRLQPGGRLVAILGGGRADDTNGGANLFTGPSGKWFDRISRQYNVRANVRINGKEYQKYGTNFATRIIVIDKDGLTKSWANVVQGNADTLEQAYNLLRDVATSRPVPQAAAARPGGQVRPGAGEPATGLGAGPVASGPMRPGVLPGEPGPGEADQLANGPAEPAGGPGALQSEPGNQQPLVREPDLGSEEFTLPPATGSTGGGFENAPELGPLEQPVNPAVIEEPLTGTEEEKTGLPMEADEAAPRSEEEDSVAYVKYRPTIKGPAHPGDIVETKTMATVPMPAITYRPNLPASVLEGGRLSAVQLEAISIAGQQNSLLLPGGARASALIGDGTGVGKGRISAGILYDNYRQGRKRLVWVSEKWPLMQDAMRDLDGVGAAELMRGIAKQKGRYIQGKDSAVRGLRDWKATQDIAHNGVLFSTYAMIRSEDAKGNRRVAQLEKWLRGEDDGEGAYILFDESHNLKNAVAGRGGQPSQIGRTVKELLERMPKLRTVSLSATAATDVINLGYLDRLGLWGAGTPFPNGFGEFQTQIAPGGVAAMEMIARELKAQGKYVSRTLSYHGVTYREEEHKLNDDQKEVYRSAAKAWNSIIGSAAQTIANLTNGGSRQLGRFNSQLFGTHQRFFNLLISTLKAPTAIELAKQGLAEGKSVVITLINTNEAAQNREKNKARSLGDEDEIPDFDFGPKEMLAQLLREHYPVQQYRDDVDSAGNPVKVPVYRKDEAGREIPVTNPAAEAARDALIAEIQKSLNMPDNPLDVLVNGLGGGAKVAEITGRKERYDSSTGKFIPRGNKETPAKDVNEFEARAFQSGQKRIAVLSGAANAGISLHAGNDVANQQTRMHITLQVGWSADKAMQMFGRTHRTNQKQPPEYVMLVSDLGGERRFVSTIAKRLGSLGALTKGQKNATSGTDLMEKVNFETAEGEQSTNSFYAAMLRDNPVPGTGVTGLQVLSDLHVLKQGAGGGPTVDPADRTNVTKLLNRMLGLDPDVQNPAYNYFYDIFQASVQDAIDRGTLDTGVKTLPGDEFNVKEQRTIGKDPQTGAETFYYPVDAQVRTNRVSPKDLAKHLREQKNNNPRVLRDDKNSIVLTVDARPIVHANGQMEEASHFIKPGRGQWVKESNRTFQRMQEVGEWAKAELEKAQNALAAAERSLEYRKQDVERMQGSAWARESVGYAQKDVEARKVTVANAQAIADDPMKWAKDRWKEQYDASPSHIIVPHHLIGGAVMRWWNPIKDSTFIRNAIFTASDSKTGQRVVGIDIPPAQIKPLLARITGGASTVNADQLYDDVLKNNMAYELEGGTMVARGRVGGNYVIRLTPGNQPIAEQLKRLGIIYERGITPLYYLPTGKEAGTIIRRVLKEYPVKQAEVPQKPSEATPETPQQTTEPSSTAPGSPEESPSPLKKFIQEETGTSSVGQALRGMVEPKLAAVGNPAAMTSQAVGAHTSAVEALRAAVNDPSDKDLGARIRTFPVGERDIRIAETNQLRALLRQVIPDHIDQEAVSLMRDFKNRPGELEQFRNGTHPFYAGLDPAEVPEAMARIQKLERVIQRALNPSPEMRQVDDYLTAYFTEHLAEGKKLGFLNSRVGNDEYITHLFDILPEEVEAQKKAGPLGRLFPGRLGPKKFKYGQERKYPTVLHAVAGGGGRIGIRSLNALDALGVYGEKYATVAAYYMLRNALKESAAGKFATYSQQKAGKVPADWVEMAPESRLFRADVAFVNAEGEPDIAHQMMFVPPFIRDAMRPVLDPNYMDLVPGFRKSRMYQAYIKQIELGLSFFHLRALNMAGLGDADLHGLLQQYMSDMQSPEFLQAEQSWVRAGLVTPVLGQTAEIYAALRPSSLPTLQDRIEGLPVVKQMSWAASAVSHLTFGIVQRKMKVTDASLQYAGWIVKHANATPEEAFEAQRQIAKQVNATYGGLNWDALGVNRMSLALAKVLFLAPDWTFSNYLNLKYAGQGGPAGRAARLFWLRSILYGVALSYGMSLLLGRKASKDPTQVYLGKDREGDDLFENLFFAGAPGDVSTLIHNSLKFGFPVGLVRTLAGKFGNLARGTMHVATNVDERGRPIIPKKTREDILGRRAPSHEPTFLEKNALGAEAVAREVAPIPFSGATIGRMLMDPKHHYSLGQYVIAALAGRGPQVTRRMAAGGTVTSPTQALVGEAGPEAVIDRGSGTDSSRLPTSPLSGEGRDEAEALAKRVKTKGGFDEIFAAELPRTLETAQILSEVSGSPLVYQGPALETWRIGGASGRPLEEIHDLLQRHVLEEPDKPLPGKSPDTGQPGESFDTFSRRGITAFNDLLNRWERKPERKLAAVTSSKVIKLGKAYVRDGAKDFRVDKSLMISKTIPSFGAVDRFWREKGRVRSEPVNMKSDAPLKPGVYYIRHGAVEGSDKVQVVTRPTVMTLGQHGTQTVVPLRPQA